MDYRESLPDGCPPEGAEVIGSRLLVYRLVRTNPPTVDDFKSQRAEKPDAVFRTSECIARGLSVHTELADSEKARKLPRLRNELICRLSLETGAGRIQQTGQPSHHTWWPLATFDILRQCEVLP